MSGATIDTLWVLTTLGKVTALFLFGCGAHVALRRAPARWRQFTWAGVLAGAALLPVLDRLLPSLEVHVPAPQALAVAPVEPVGAAPATLAVEPVTALAPRPSTISLRSTLLTLWLMGVALGLIRLATSLLRLKGLAARASELREPAWVTTCSDSLALLPSTRNARVLTSTEVATPITFGTRRPVVLLPDAALPWSSERRHIVLLHELVHVAHRDWFVQIAGQVVRAIYWFHPLAHVATKQLAAERERACDERVIALGASPSEYASQLLAIALSLPRREAPSAALAMVRRSRAAQLEGRLMSILEATPHRNRPIALGLVSALALSVPALAAIQPRPEPSAHDCPCTSHVEHGAANAQREAEQLRERAERILELQSALSEAEISLAEQRARVGSLRERLDALRSSTDRNFSEAGRLRTRLLQEMAVERMNSQAREQLEKAMLQRSKEMLHGNRQAPELLQLHNDEALERLHEALNSQQQGQLQRAQKSQQRALELLRSQAAAQRFLHGTQEHVQDALGAYEGALDSVPHDTQHDQEAAKRFYLEALEHAQEAHESASDTFWRDTQRHKEAAEKFWREAQRHESKHEAHEGAHETHNRARDGSSQGRALARFIDSAAQASQQGTR